MARTKQTARKSLKRTSEGRARFEHSLFPTRQSFEITSSRCAAGSETDSSSSLHIQASCLICYQDYCSLARERGNAFGVLQCTGCGNHLCQGCWNKLQGQPRKCPSCRRDFSHPLHNRLVEESISKQPAECKWQGCSQTGLTIETLSAHESACEHKIMSCVCQQFSGKLVELHAHQKSCISHHLLPIKRQIQFLKQTHQTSSTLQTNRSTNIDQRLEAMQRQIAMIESAAASSAGDILQLKTQVQQLQSQAQQDRVSNSLRMAMSSTAMEIAQHVRSAEQPTASVSGGFSLFGFRLW